MIVMLNVPAPATLRRKARTGVFTVAYVELVAPTNEVAVVLNAVGVTVLSNTSSTVD
jgi:hypothetical protein